MVVLWLCGCAWVQGCLCCECAGGSLGGGDDASVSQEGGEVVGPYGVFSEGMKTKTNGK